MSNDFLTATEAARCLGVAVATFYDWLARSDAGLLVIREQPVTIRYFQGGARGQGRIRLETAEVQRLRELFRVQPRPRQARPAPPPRRTFPGIHVPLGRPPTLPFL